MTQTKVQQIVKRLERTHSDDYSAFLGDKVPDVPLEKAIHTKNLDYLKMLHKYGIFIKMFLKKPKYYFELVVRYGGMEMFKWIHSLRLCDIHVSFIFQLAIKQGNMALTQYLFEKERCIHTATLRKVLQVEDVTAFHPNSPRICQWLYEKGFRVEESMIMEHAAYFGDEEVFRWFYKKGFQGQHKAVFGLAVQSGNDSFIDWLYNEGYRAEIYADMVLYWAVKTGKFNLIQSIYEKGYRSSEDIVLREAARNGDIHLLKWLNEKGYPVIRRQVFLWATYSGNLDTVNWLYNSRYGTLRQWVYSKIEGSDSMQAMEGAITSGNLELVKWLFSKGFRCTGKRDQCLFIASKYRHIDIRDWVQKHIQ